MKQQRQSLRGGSRVAAAGALTVVLMMIASCVQNQCMLRSIELEDLDQQLACLHQEEEGLDFAWLVLTDQDRVQRMASASGLTPSWGALRCYRVEHADAPEQGLLAEVWRDTKDVVLAMVAPRPVYAQER
jgi:cell division protein FtsL